MNMEAVTQAQSRRRRWCFSLLALSALALSVVLGCVYPTERGDELRVLIDSIPDLLQGDVYLVTGSVVDAAGNAVPNAEVAFESQNIFIAAVGEEGGLLAVSPGTVDVVGTAVGFADAEPGVRGVRVHDLLEIDSLRPSPVRYGDTLHVYGTGLNPEKLIFISVGGQLASPVAGWTPFDPAAPDKFGRLTVWVSLPAPRQSQALVIGLEGVTTSPDSVRVIQQDIYEPNDTIPRVFDSFDASISNPALAFEFRDREDSLRTDWYRFTHVDGDDRTILIRSTGVGPESYQVFFTDSLFWDSAVQDFAVGPTSWAIGPGLGVCQGVPFTPEQRPADSTVVALRNLPPGTYDLIAAYTFPGAYEMRVVRGYRSALEPDAAEENDYCDVATPLSVGATRSLTIDNPHDTDWFEFTVTATDQPTQFAVTATIEDADLDVYLLLDDLPNALPLVELSQGGGLNDIVTATLSPGHYYLVVVDFAGVPTPYTLSTSVVATPSGGVRASVPAAAGKPGVDPMILRSRR